MASASLNSKQFITIACRGFRVVLAKIFVTLTHFLMNWNSKLILAIQIIIRFFEFKWFNIQIRRSNSLNSFQCLPIITRSLNENCQTHIKASLFSPTNLLVVSMSNPACTFINLYPCLPRAICLYSGFLIIKFSSDKFLYSIITMENLPFLFFPLNLNILNALHTFHYKKFYGFLFVREVLQYRYSFQHDHKIVLFHL